MHKELSDEPLKATDYPIITYLECYNISNDKKVKELYPQLLEKAGKYFKTYPNASVYRLKDKSGNVLVYAIRKNCNMNIDELEEKEINTIYTSSENTADKLMGSQYYYYPQITVIIKKG